MDFFRRVKKKKASPNKAKYFAGCFAASFSQIQQSPTSLRNGNMFHFVGLEHRVSFDLSL